MAIAPWQPKAPAGIQLATRPSVHDEARRLRQTFGKAELKKLCELLGGEEKAKTVVKVVEKYVRGVPTTVEE